MIREKLLQKLIKEASGSCYVPLAKRIGITHVSLWRIVKGKTQGSTKNWDAIFKYYGR
jgi:predicted transcriptional regulator